MSWFHSILNSDDCPFKIVEFGEWNTRDSGTVVPVKTTDYDIVVAWLNDSFTEPHNAVSSSNSTNSCLFVGGKSTSFFGRDISAVCGSYYNNTGATQAGASVGALNVQGSAYGYWGGKWNYIALKFK